MKQLYSVLFFCIFLCIAGFTQSTGTKLLNGAWKARNTAANAAEAARGAKSTASDVKETFRTLFPKKDKAGKQKEVAANAQPSEPAPAAQPQSADNKTLITVSNIDYAKLKSFEENIKACGMVKTTERKFFSGASTIAVTHTGPTTELLDMMLQTCKDVFLTKNIESSEEGKISIKL